MTAGEFMATPLQPLDQASDAPWYFVVLPPEVSATLPRRGRLTAAVWINDERFDILLEPDGRKSHWMRIEPTMLQAARAEPGVPARFRVAQLETQPETEVPDDLIAALSTQAAAQQTWASTTTLARVDWIHWLTSAKQAGTRAKRVRDACEMLADGKKRVCCFDPSGFYSKAFKAPEAKPRHAGD